MIKYIWGKPSFCTGDNGNTRRKYEWLKLSKFMKTSGVWDKNPGLVRLTPETPLRGREASPQKNEHRHVARNFSSTQVPVSRSYEYSIKRYKQKQEQSFWRLVLGKAIFSYSVYARSRLIGHAHWCLKWRICHNLSRKGKFIVVSCFNIHPI